MLSHLPRLRAYKQLTEEPLDEITAPDIKVLALTALEDEDAAHAIYHRVAEARLIASLQRE